LTVALKITVVTWGRVSTRKVAEITKEPCGLAVSSSQVSRVAELLDKEPEA
jgi:transposase-like protein